MLMLYRRQRVQRPGAASTPPRSVTERGLSSSDDDCAWDTTLTLTVAPVASPAGEYLVDQTAQLALVPPAPAPATSPALPPRRPSRRYRSRNCGNFKRYGDLFQFVDAGGEYAAADGDYGGGSDDGSASDWRGLPVRWRRTVRAHNRLLTAELRDVQQRVAELERQRDLLHSTMLNAHASAVAHALTMVKQFYVLFANGYNPSASPQQSRRAEAFLRAVMSDDVLCTEFRGVDTFLQQYETSSRAHASLRLALKDVTLVSSESADGTIQVQAEAVCTLRIKRATLEQLFPAIVRDEALTQQLIGREYVLQYDKVFHFHGARVFQHESRVDFCTGMLNMVQDPYVAMQLIDASVMTRHGHLKLDHRVEEDAHVLTNSVL